MEFKKASIDGNSYGFLKDEVNDDDDTIDVSYVVVTIAVRELIISHLTFACTR